jgi:hypothetical protein
MVNENSGCLQNRVMTKPKILILAYVAIGICSLLLYAPPIFLFLIDSILLGLAIAIGKFEFIYRRVFSVSFVIGAGTLICRDLFLFFG